MAQNAVQALRCEMLRPNDSIGVLSRLLLRPRQGSRVLWWACLSDLSVCLSVCVYLSVRDHIFGTTRTIFKKFFMLVTYGRSSVVLWHAEPMKTDEHIGDVVTASQIENEPCCGILDWLETLYDVHMLFIWWLCVYKTPQLLLLSLFSGSSSLFSTRTCCSPTLSRQCRLLIHLLYVSMSFLFQVLVSLDWILSSTNGLIICFVYFCVW